MTRRMMRNVITAMSLAGLLAAGLRSHATQEPKTKNEPNSAKLGAEKPKTNAKTKGVANLRMAADLVTYGRETKSPEALILAARILATTPVKAGGGSAKLVGGSAKSEKSPASAKELDPETLLTEAKKMSDDAHIAALINETRKIVAERSRGEIDGPAVNEGFANANSTVTWTAVFRGNEVASVTIAGYGGADFDLYVFDDRGNLISQDTGPTANATCTWYPSYTSTFTFRVVNCSPFGSQYRFINN